MTDSPKLPLVVKTTPHPCGCVETHYADGRTTVQTCPPCGLAEAGKALEHAGRVLLATAQAMAQGRPIPPLRRV